MSDDHTPHEHDLGLSHDLPTVLNRRRALGLLSAAGLAAALAACSGGNNAPDSSGGGSTSNSSGGAGSATAPTAATAVDEIPEETAGPFPADGSNGVDVLTESGIVRPDISASFGGSSTVAAGVPVSVALRVVDLSGETVTPYAGAAVYLWHCDQLGRYSMYDDEIVDENYLRGVQVADADGRLSFTTVFPGAYPGRWPHMHFEVYPDEASAVTSSGRLRTSQLAIPEDACTDVYATSGYDNSAQNLRRTSLDSDSVFGDGYSLQLATASGSVDEGYALTLTVAV
ncbi:dioxygenase family protein [Aeromicrobium fastidiosum]|uniref:3,4-dioxygenase subunit beta n=1 Tax=Aeromicrobium fastidiosum TaxID=52699 RepID=A0A641ALU6_9ACTN|nr:3,4-dioxygenase subunit beta [Aeromicrobium fastidiosum]KAA1378244.1 3,4-dioxygenase subunit beta [Aeromicrobium fastidiosum]MBP2388941.1 protocatechuate 3,4-dioxygenase beta subunit [Aeromicrobium fastidiosum]